MSAEATERIYTINLGKVLLSPNNQRAKRAINMIREFAIKHMKSENIKIEEEISHLVWARGIRHPPRKIRVKITKDDGNVIVSKYQEDKKAEESKSEKKSDDKKKSDKLKKEEKKVEEKKEDKKEKTEKKTEEKKEPKTEEKPKKVEKKTEEKAVEEKKEKSEKKTKKE
ncbi:MAG: 50S ribosomal protein L31e [Thaumarchaeota archaeon]|nr:50S ribosomal protein L31e [Nitrososphaerota archaeon]